MQKGFVTPLQAQPRAEAVQPGGLPHSVGGAPPPAMALTVDEMRALPRQQRRRLERLMEKVASRAGAVQPEK